ncbi:MAG: hypothetical protein ABEI06_04440 [Halobacteriaceae archaeon]
MTEKINPSSGSKGNRLFNMSLLVVIGIISITSLIIAILFVLAIVFTILNTGHAKIGLLLLGGFISFAIAYWGLVWWVEKNGIGPWNTKDRKQF